MALSKVKYIVLALMMMSANLSAQNKIKVISSASIFDDMVKNIGGSWVEHSAIVPVGGDPHLYEPTPDDAKMIGSADLVLINGLTFEGWINELIDNSGTKARTVLITEGIRPISSLTYKNATDPHAWMDARNGLIYLKNIKDALSEADPGNKGVYEKNYMAYKSKVEKLDQYITEQVESIPAERRVLITSHDAFQYYGKAYGIKLNAIMGISTEADVQTSDLLRVSNSIKESKVPAIFIESTINPKMIQQIAKDNKVAIGGELYADSIGEEGSEGDSYLKMLRHNTDVIVQALRDTEMSVTKVDEDEHSGANMWLIGGVIAAILLLSLLFVIKKVNG